MHALVLAGGEGSRMAADGVAAPKALVELGGRPQLVRLLETCLELGSPTATCLIRDDVPAGAPGAEPWAHLPAERVRVLRCHTLSSLHTLVEGLARLPAGPVFCTMVDTVMPRTEWRRAYDAMERALAGGADAALLTTPFIDDEKPLYVRVDPAGRVREVGPTPMEPLAVTGGVYAFGPRARSAAAAALLAGHARMRALLEILTHDQVVVAVETAKVIDLDHRSDLLAADAWLAAVDPRPYALNRTLS